MKLPRKLKISPRFARKANVAFQKVAYWLVDMDAEEGGQDSRTIE